MQVFDHVKRLTPAQRNTFLASFLGWTLDAFDFFILPFVAVKIALEFHVGLPAVIFASTATLMLRPVGALLFGALADRFGRRGPLMLDIGLYSLLELASGFAPNLTVFILLRALFGVAMGGEWGLGAAMALETLPTESRGFFSGLLQQGYAVGNLLAAAVTALAFNHVGWRGMFFIGTVPALLVLFIRSSVPIVPLPAVERKAARVSPLQSFLRHTPLVLFAVVLMTGFNCMSHGTQDLYPTFLTQQRGLSVGLTSTLAIIASVGAILGGTLFGAFSQQIGRRRAIVVAVVCGLCALPLWVYAPATPLLALGGFLLQFAVQGAWGVIPVHLNELAPAELRASFPGVTYQLGNLFAAGFAQFESSIATHQLRFADGTPNFSAALALSVALVFVFVGVLTMLGPERRNIALLPTL